MAYLEIMYNNYELYIKKKIMFKLLLVVIIYVG